MIFHQSEAIQNILKVIVDKCDANYAYVTSKDSGKANRNSLSREGTFCDDCWNTVLGDFDDVTELDMDALVPSAIKDKLQNNGAKSMMLLPIWKDDNRSQVVDVMIICNSKAHHAWCDADKSVAMIGAEIIAAAMRLGSTVPDQILVPSPTVYQEETADLIAEAFNEIRKSPKNGLDLWEEKGCARFKSLISNFIKQGLPIPFVMPAFPFKSRNTETKVTGSLPDKGEELALQTLANFAGNVKRVYSPGAEMLVISDGHVFNDIYEIDDDVTTEYQNKLFLFFSS